MDAGFEARLEEIRQEEEAKKRAIEEAERKKRDASRARKEAKLRDMRLAENRRRMRKEWMQAGNPFTLHSERRALIKISKVNYLKQDGSPSEVTEKELTM